MSVVLESRGAAVVYEHADVVISAVGPYGRREQRARIVFSDPADPLLPLLIRRAEMAAWEQAASEPPTMGPIG